MPQTSIEMIVEARLRALERELPDTVQDPEVIYEGGFSRAVITVADASGNTLCVEFIEDEESLLRPLAVDQFNEATANGVKALVIVPDRAHLAAAELLSRTGNPSVELASFSVVGISLLA
jgi:hypothetical protein